MKKKVTRFQEIDLFRGMVLLGMIIFHIFFILDFFQIASSHMDSGIWLIFARIIQFGFLGIVGISLAISAQKYPWPIFLRKQLKRALHIGSLAIIVSIATYIVIPEHFIIFGILHLIATSILLLLFTAKRPYLSLIIGFIFFGIGLVLDNFSSPHIFPFILGAKTTTISTIDYFPLFPWIAVVAFGIFLGHILYPQNTPRLNIKLPKFLIPISFLGKHSLFLYIAHVPAILLFLIALKIISIQNFF